MGDTKKARMRAVATATGNRRMYQNKEEDHNSVGAQGSGLLRDNSSEDRDSKRREHHV